MNSLIFSALFALCTARPHSSGFYGGHKHGFNRHKFGGHSVVRPHQRAYAARVAHTAYRTHAKPLAHVAHTGYRVPAVHSSHAVPVAHKSYVAQVSPVRHIAHPAPHPSYAAPAQSVHGVAHAGHPALSPSVHGAAHAAHPALAHPAHVVSQLPHPPLAHSVHGVALAAHPAITHPAHGLPHPGHPASTHTIQGVAHAVQAHGGVYKDLSEHHAVDHHAAPLPHTHPVDTHSAVHNLPQEVHLGHPSTFHGSIPTGLSGHHHAVHNLPSAHAVPVHQTHTVPNHGAVYEDLSDHHAVDHHTAPLAHTHNPAALNHGAIFEDHSDHHPAALAVPSAQITQYQTDDGLGNSSFGYQTENSSRQEQRTPHGVSGSYSYVDEAGHHTVNYVADQNGYRIV